MSRHANPLFCVRIHNTGYATSPRRHVGSDSTHACKTKTRPCACILRFNPMCVKHVRVHVCKTRLRACILLTHLSDALRPCAVQIEHPDRLLLRNMEGDQAARLQRAQGIVRDLREGNTYAFVNELKIPPEDRGHWRVSGAV